MLLWMLVRPRWHKFYRIPHLISKIYEWALGWPLHGVQRSLLSSFCQLSSTQIKALHWIIIFLTIKFMANTSKTILWCIQNLNLVPLSSSFPFIKQISPRDSTEKHPQIITLHPPWLINEIKHHGQFCSPFFSSATIQIWISLDNNYFFLLLLIDPFSVFPDSFEPFTFLSFILSSR